MSPEIGNEKTNFFPEKSMILPNLKVNYPPISYIIKKLLFHPK